MEENRDNFSKINSTRKKEEHQKSTTKGKLNCCY